ncbi:MAG: AraC family transcriptional regulator [Pigmentiphaga sp.]
MTQPTISILFVRDAMEHTTRLGFDASLALRRADIPPSLLTSPLARISQAQLSTFVRTLQRMTRDELWGLCPQPLALGTFGQMCQVACTQSTLGEALKAGVHFYHILQASFVIRLGQENGMATLRLSDRLTPEQRRPVHSTILLAMHHLASWLIDRRLSLAGVRFGFGTSSRMAEINRVFHTDIEYGHSCTSLIFDAGWLAESVVQDAASLQRFLRFAPGALLVGYRDERSVTEAVRRRLRRRLDESMSLEDVAHTLRMPALTLRRRLQKEAITFSQLKDDVRRDAAIDLLRERSLGLDEIANKLGFSELSSFHRAFRRWTGLAPGEFRTHGGD